MASPFACFDFARWISANRFTSAWMRGLLVWEASSATTRWMIYQMFSTCSKERWVSLAHDQQNLKLLISTIQHGKRFLRSGPESSVGLSLNSPQPTMQVPGLSDSN